MCVQILKTRLADEAASKERAATAKDPDVEDLEKKVRELKDKNRQLILEKTELQRVSESLSAAGHFAEFDSEDCRGARGRGVERTISRSTTGGGECAPPDPLAARPPAQRCCHRRDSSAESAPLSRKRARFASYSGDSLSVRSSETRGKVCRARRRRRHSRRSYFLWLLICLGLSLLYRLYQMATPEGLTQTRFFLGVLWSWALDTYQQGMQFLSDHCVGLFPGSVAMSGRGSM